MKSAGPITVERLRQFLKYDPDTGLFTWIANRRRDLIGRIAGKSQPSPNGYLHVRIDERDYYAHRLAWLYMTGSWPKGQVDHRDGVRSNNKWGNLRDVDQSQNNANSRPIATPERKGISRERLTGKWAATIWKNGQRYRLGRFATQQEAQDAYNAAAREMYGEFARLPETAQAESSA